MQEKKKNLDLALNCPACGSLIEESSANFINERETKTIFHTICKKCQTASLIFVFQTEKGMMSVGMATDLNREEALGIFDLKAISADEVIEVYRLMNETKERKIG